MKAILGINAVFHDSSAAVLAEGRLSVLAEEERYSRVRGAKRAAVDATADLPYRAVSRALEAAGLSFADLDCVAYSFDPELRRRALEGAPADPGVPEDGYGGRRGEKRFRELILQTEELLAVRYGRRVPVVFIPHHEAHMASAYYSCPWDEAALLAVDGIGEQDTCVWGLGRAGRVERTGSIGYHHSLGFLWESMTRWLGLQANQDEGTVMALAAYGDPARFREALRRVLRPEPDGTFRADPAFARFRSGDVAGLESLLGPKREAAVPIVFAGTDRRHADAAASLQELTEELILGLAGKLCKDTGSANLALAGGVALNCQANGALARSGIFERLWVFPAAKDCGTAFGAAAMAWLKRRGPPVREEWRHAFLGAPDKAGSAELALSARGLKGEALGPRALVEKAADLLASGKIVAWYEGAMEVGPRALGHRSLLADPRSDAMKRRLNERIKHRQPFRPYGPVLREEDADRFFEIPEAARLPCRFMLAAVRARAQAYESIPAALHADGTARPQLIGAREHPRLHALLGAFEKRTGVPALLNTSFNDREPIVGVPEDALATYLRTEVDALVMEERLLVKTPSALIPLGTYAPPRGGGA